MKNRRLLVIGATGDVGQGIVAIARQRGWRVAAAGRSAEKLARFGPDDPDRVTLVGDLGSEAGAEQLWAAAANALDGIDTVVIAVNAPNALKPLIAWTPAELTGVFDANLMTHFIAAKTFLPKLPSDGVFLGIGGGTADFIIPTMTHVSMTQAAQRMMYRGLARENRDGAAVRELMIVSMVNGESKREKAAPEWVTEMEVGEHVCAIIADPAAFAGPILTLKTREQVGQPGDKQ